MDWGKLIRTCLGRFNKAINLSSIKHKSRLKEKVRFVILDLSTIIAEMHKKDQLDSSMLTTDFSSHSTLTMQARIHYATQLNKIIETVEQAFPKKVRLDMVNLNIAFEPLLQAVAHLANALEGVDKQLQEEKAPQVEDEQGVEVLTLTQAIVNAIPLSMRSRSYVDLPPPVPVQRHNNRLQFDPRPGFGATSTNFIENLLNRNVIVEPTNDNNGDSASLLRPASAPFVISSSVEPTTEAATAPLIVGSRFFFAKPKSEAEKDATDNEVSMSSMIQSK